MAAPTEPVDPKGKKTTAPPAGSPTGRKPAARRPPPAGATKKTTAFARRRGRRLQALVGNAELVSLVCHCHVRGCLPVEIQKLVKKKFRIEMKREDPGYVVRWAAQNDMLSFHPHHEDVCRRKIKDLWPSLTDLEVISSVEVEVIAAEGARMLLKMLRAYAGRKTVVVGVAGGHTMRALMRSLARQLADSQGDLPEIVHFRALAAGFDPDDPTTNPNAFVTFFDGKLIPAKIRFTGLSAPAIVTQEIFDQLRGFGDIGAAFDMVKTIDIFVTSGTSWHHCGSLTKRMGEADRQVLEDLGVVGDVLWRPIADAGPINANTDRRAFTLVELGQLRERVEQHTQVLVTLAPCGLCEDLKGALLACIRKHKLATHVVIDTRSAQQFLGKSSQQEPGR